MLNINQLISDELNIKLWQAENTLTLRQEGGTIPFIARYRKEKTGELDENQIRDIFDRFDYLTELEDRKQTILKSIEEQGKLTEELKNKILNCLQKNELEDLYLPYKPKKRTRATIAKEKGLEALAIAIKENNQNGDVNFDPELEAGKFINAELGVNNIKEALAGASDIIAEEISENAQLRQWLRDFFAKNGIFTSKIKDEFEVGSTKFETYRDFQIPVSKITPHVMLALRRGENEKILNLDMTFEEDEVLSYFEFKNIHTLNTKVKAILKNTVKDAFNRLMKHSIIGEVRLDKKLYSDEESIKVFGENLRQILLSAPAGSKPTLGVDPGFRTGCKVAVVDSTGKFLEYQAIFPHTSDYQKQEAEKTLVNFIKKYEIELIAIGNGTAGRETETFINDILNKNQFEKKPIKVMVNESGASIYSASKVAGEEFPELDLTVRGAISIARRLQDPLAELVKIDPKSIGVGQYQHDVDQKLLKKKLDENVESCVNFVGVDLNSASKELLSYVAGINESIAKSIVEFRNKNGKFNTRKELLKVPKFGPKAFEQAAGFLRIRNGENVLDNTAVHPESYHIVEVFAKDLNASLNEISKFSEQIKNLNLKKYITDTIGEPTLRDIISELEKPGRDPRQVFKYAEFKEGISEISHLRVGMELEGVVTNVTNFGAFVDIGVHQDGLVHISEIANGFVQDPTKHLKVGQVVNVKVIDINEKLKRIQLSIKQLLKNTNTGKNFAKNPAPKSSEPSFSVNDLKARFSK